MEADQNVLNQKVSSSNEVVVVISDAEETSRMSTPKTPPEMSIRRRTIGRSPCSKHKSRLVEPPYPRKAKVVQEISDQTVTAAASSPYRYRTSPIKNSPYNESSAAAAGIGKERKRTKTPGSITPKTPLLSSPDGEDGHDDDDADADADNEVYATAGHSQVEVEVKKRGKNVKFLILIEWIAFLSILGILIASLFINKLKNKYIWGLHIWKWSLLVLIVFCGNLVTGWFMDFLVFFIERNYLLKKKVLYFIYGLRKSVRVSVCLGLILLTWTLLINRGVKRSRRTTRALNYITRGIACTLIGACLWMIKTFLVKLLASSFHVTTFFDRIQDSIFHQYVLQTLSGPALLEYGGSSKSSGRLSFKQATKLGKQKGLGEEIIDVDKLYKMKKEKVSAWTMGGLIKVIRGSGLSTISELLDESEDNEGIEQKEITNEFEAKAAAKQIFKKVDKSGKGYIDEEDLSIFMPKEEVDNVLMMFEGAAETGHIKKADFKSWAVKVYKERKYLAHSLNDTKTAVEELNKIASGLILVISIMLWLVLMGIATTQVLVFISSQLLLVVFMFGNTAKTVFEAIIFIFVTHPFDVGDKCVIDGVQMLVEEMNILTTIFLRYDNELIYYPNAVLATKPISNFNRSPEMADSVEFSVDFSTSVESIAAIKSRIKGYLESKPEQWRPGHGVVIKEIENMNKLKMALNVTHTVNFQSPERGNRISDLVLELKRIFEDLDIKYHLLPQQVHLKYV